MRAAKILVLSDDEKYAQSLEWALLLDNFSPKIFVCRDGMRPIEGYFGRQSAFDLVLVDIHKPRSSILPFAVSIKKGMANIPMIVTTDVAETNVIDTLLTLGDTGVDGFMSKPFKLSDLTDKIESLLVKSSSGSLASDAA